MIINDVPIECINQAAIQFHVPAVILTSVLLVENGRVGSARINKNGTVDYGPMQINTVWANQLSQYGYSTQQLQYNACINIWAGAWILSQKLARDNNFWHAVGSYHSFSTQENYRYQLNVARQYLLITQPASR